jgi:hypothetical protein
MHATRVESHWLGAAQRGSPALIRFIVWVGASRAYLARVLDRRPHIRDVFHDSWAAPGGGEAC